MDDSFPPLDSFGRRIMICGPSNSGKSTLAAALGRKLGLSVTHLDLLYHRAGTNWVPRPPDEFIALHDAALSGATWIMEGNYFGAIPQRLRRATGIVFLGSGRWAGLSRYVRRTLFQPQRAGKLEGGIDRLNLKMIQFILIEQPPKRHRYRSILAASGLPLLELNSMAETKRLYAAWGLTRG